MRISTLLVLAVLALLVVVNSRVRADQGTESEGSEISAMSSPSPPRTSASEESSEESSESRSRRGGIKSFGGGKVTIISNNNRLVHIEEPKKRRSPAELEAESRRTHQEETEKRESENRGLERQEQARKKEREDKERREKEAEQDRKRQAQEQDDKKAAESKTKSELEERQKAAERERREREAAEGRQKKQEEEGAKERQRRADEEEEKRKQEGTDADANIESGWRNYGGGYQNLRVGRWKRFVFVTGLLAGEGGHMATLPEKYRPRGGRLIFNLIKGNLDSRVDVLEDGRVFHIAGGGSSWLSLDGIFFPRRNQETVELMNNWINFGYGYRPTTQHKQADYCMLSGLIRQGSWGYLGRMRSNCFPNQRLIFSANNHASIARVDVLPNGYFVYVAGSNNHGWINLDGISFTVNPGQYLPLYNGWGNYGGGYRPASYSKNGRVCSVSGLIRSNTWHGHITTLPPGCRPASRLIFGGNVHIKSARIDVLENGAVVYVTGKAHWEWLSLDGIKFIAQK